MSRPLKITLVGVLVVLLAGFAAAQSAPPNPYHVQENWAQLPSGMKWAGVISIQPDAKDNIWVFHRGETPILEFAQSGRVLRSFGKDMFVQAHGMAIDKDGNVWVTDSQSKDNKGQQVFKFSPEGKVLMTLGTAGAIGEGPDRFSGPADVVVAGNGDIFVADGHVAMSNGRIVKFNKDGKFIKAWGKLGAGPGEFNVPHSIAMDSRGRIFVADRSNHRIQIFDQDGKFIDQWKQFGRPSGIYISKDDTLYSVDSQSDEMTNPGVKRGIRIGSAKDGSVRSFVPDLSTNPQIALAEG